MRDVGLETAVKAAGGVSTLARLLGVSQPAISSWRRVPAERVLAVESATGVSRQTLRPDLYPADLQQDRAVTTDVSQSGPAVDPIDQARADEYALLAALLGREPSTALLAEIARLSSGEGILGEAHGRLALAAAQAQDAVVGREYFRVFIGVGRGELLPYASYYLTGFVHERPLAAVRADLARLGLARDGSTFEPEDHIAILCETMAGVIAGHFEAAPGEDRVLFDRHLRPWAARFFADLEQIQEAPFYAAVGTVGRVFMEIEAEAFDLGE